MIRRLAERELATKFGSFLEVLFYDGQAESIALVVGDVADGEGVLCRVHSSCLGGHVFNSIECECAAEMVAAQVTVQAAGRGVIIYLEQEGRGNGHLALMLSIPYKKAGMSQSDAYIAAGYQADARDYTAAAEILQNLGVRSVVLLTNNPDKAEDLRRIGVNVTSTKALFPDSD